MTIVCRWSSGPDSENGYMRPKTTAAENKSSADKSTKVETDGTKTEGDSGSWQNGVETVVEDGARGEREGTVGEAVDRDGVVDAESDIDTVPVGDGGSADAETGIDTVGVRKGEGGDDQWYSAGLVPEKCTQRPWVARKMCQRNRLSERAVRWFAWVPQPAEGQQREWPLRSRCCQRWCSKGMVGGMVGNSGVADVIDGHLKNLHPPDTANSQS
ncbi:hypothetical protein EDB84DRAFT_1440605 [Lactarius hengduanensis]|nr:hypothetical protein EDB84DRAFT_1440605 [Lactarius hengduanensis]